MAKTFIGSAPASDPQPNQRNCCLLTPLIPPLVVQPGVGVVDPSNLGPHKYGGGDIYGSVYTCAAGFLDLGHLRDHIDLTKYYYDLLKKNKFVANITIKATAFDGIITTTKAIPKADRIEVARSIAYSQSVAYEIIEYWYNVPGFHNSAFSPEDLVSNFLGTYVAAQALQASGSFDTAATKALSDLLTLVGARAPADTMVAFQKIAGIYITSITNVVAFQSKDFLKRRNFNVSPISPCLIPGINGCSSTTFPSSIPTQFDPRISTYYDMSFSTPADTRLGVKIGSGQAHLGTSFQLSDFTKAIADIQADSQNPANPCSLS